MEEKYLMRWRRNIGFVIVTCTILPSICTVFVFIYFAYKDLLFLIISLVILVLVIILLLTKFHVWNERIYLNKEKIWITKKDKTVEWRIDDIISCKIKYRPRWSRFIYMIIQTKSNPELLIFDYNIKVEKMLLEITEGNEVKKIFLNAWK